MTKKSILTTTAMLAVIILSVLFSCETESKNEKLSSEGIKEAYTKSFSYEKQQDYDSAISAMVPVFNDYQDSYTVNLRLGWLNYLKMNYSDSIDYYSTAMKLAPDSIESKLGYSLPLLAQEKYEDVENTVNDVIKIDYYNYTANLRLAYVLRLEKKYDLAINTSVKMLAVYPTNVSFMLELALSRFANGEKDAASDLMWNVLVLDPENVTANEYFQ